MLQEVDRWAAVVGQTGEVLETGRAGDASEATEAAGGNLAPEVKAPTPKIQMINTEVVVLDATAAILDAIRGTSEVVEEKVLGTAHRRRHHDHHRVSTHMPFN